MFKKKTHSGPFFCTAECWWIRATTATSISPLINLQLYTSSLYVIANLTSLLQHITSLPFKFQWYIYILITRKMPLVSCNVQLSRECVHYVASVMWLQIWGINHTYSPPWGCIFPVVSWLHMIAITGNYVSDVHPELKQEACVHSV